MKTLKKLVLKKETVVNLAAREMNSLRGGDVENSFGYIGCQGSYNPLDCVEGGVTEYTGHTAPPRCCEFGCCETVGC